MNIVIGNLDAIKGNVGLVNGKSTTKNSKLLLLSAFFFVVDKNSKFLFFFIKGSRIVSSVVFIGQVLFGSKRAQMSEVVWEGEQRGLTEWRTIINVSYTFLSLLPALFCVLLRCVPPVA